MASPGLAPDGSLKPCRLTATSEPWTQRGESPRGGAIFAGWIGDRYVHVEDERDAGLVHAHIYRPDRDRWARATFDVVPTEIRARLRAAGAAMKYSGFTAHDVGITETRLVLAPQYVGPIVHAGAVLDPATSRWTPIARADARWLGSSSWIASSGGMLLFWPQPASPHSRAGTRTLLFDPAAMRWLEVTAPPVSLDRDGGMVTFDDRHIVYWGGYRRDQHNNPATLLGDGAAFDLRARRWRKLPRGFAPGVGPTAFVGGGRLLLFGGSDPIRAHQQPAIPWHLKDHIVQDVAILDLAKGAWSRPFRWDAWHAWRPGLEPCTGCGPRVRVGNRLFFNRIVVYDGDTHTLRRAPVAPAPASWREVPGAYPQPLLGHAIDDRHAIVLSQTSAAAAVQAVVFDTISLGWCGLALPTDFAGRLQGARLSTHGRALYLWADGHTVEREMDTNCPPGAPCAAPPRIKTYVPPESVIVRMR